MKKAFLLFSIFVCLFFCLQAQNNTTWDLPGAGSGFYVAAETIDLEPGYYSNSMLAFTGRQSAIKWQMKERFGIDADGNGLIDLPNAYKYANPDGGFEVFFSVELSDLPTLQDFGLTGADTCVACTTPTDCIWYIDSQKQVVNLPMDKFKPTFLMQDEVTYTVRAELVFEHNGKKLVYCTPDTEVTPNDILILAMGDSYGSGEGNPDRVMDAGLKWADASVHTEMTTARPGYQPISIELDHIYAHRSTTVWSALAAMQIEKNDPHTSVTYVNVAAGGADIEQMVSEIHSSKGGARLHPYAQFEEASRIIGKNRKVEALLINIGGNNLGFQSAMMSYKVPGIKYRTIAKSVATGNYLNSEYKILIEWATKDKIDFEHRSGMNLLPGKFDELAAAIKNYFPSVQHVYVPQYPEIYLGCSSILSGELGNLNRKDIAHAKKTILDPLNALIVQKCAQHNWKTFKPSGWDNHGECKRMDPILSYPPSMPGFHQTINQIFGDTFPQISDFSGDYKWINGISDSEKIQGDYGGAAHPNGLGHLAMAGDFLSDFMPQIEYSENVTRNPSNEDFNGDK